MDSSKRADKMIRCYTLCDITRTKYTKKPQGSQDIKIRNQQRNYETFIQLISLRCQPSTNNDPECLDQQLSDFNFGSDYGKSRHLVWIFDFDVDRQEVFSTATNEFGAIVNDFNNIPVISKLDETAKINNIINTLGNSMNTYFKKKI